MTEYELVDAIASYNAAGGTFFTIWLSTLSAYAITAYIAGRGLTSFQVLWLNTLYLFASWTLIFAFHGSFRSSVFYAQQVRELNPASPHTIVYEVILIVTILAIAGTFATLKFMWDIRHAKTESSDE